MSTAGKLPRGELSGVEGAGWAGSRNDFIYLGAGKNSSTPAETVLAYENPDRVAGNLNVLLGDGTAQLWDRATAATTIGFPLQDPTDPPPAFPTLATDVNINQSLTNLQAI